MSIAELVGGGQVDVTGVGTAEAALEAIQARRFDCAVVDLGLPDLPGAELIERIRRTKGGEELPIVSIRVRTSRRLRSDVSSAWPRPSS